MKHWQNDRRKKKTSKSIKEQATKINLKNDKD